MARDLVRSTPRLAALAAAALAGLLGLLLGPAGATENEDPGPPATTTKESRVPIDRLLDDPLAPYERERRAAAVTEQGTKEPVPVDEAKPCPRLLNNLKVVLNLRSYVLDRSKFDDTMSEAWAVGGSLAVHTGWIRDRVAFGVGVYGSAPLYAPEDKDGTLLLAPGQEAYGCLGQFYGDLKVLPGVVLSAGAKEYTTPYVNKHDNRMTPNSFEAYTLIGKHGGKDGRPELAWGVGYFRQVKLRNADQFVSMSEAAGAVGVDHGTWSAGAKVSTERFSLGAIAYHCEDVIDIGYAEATWSPALRGRLGLKFAAQATYQASTGEDLLTGSDFETYEVGGRADVSYGPVMGTLAYTSVGTERDAVSPWSSCPGYTSVQVQDFNRAGEDAAMAKVALDLGKAAGLSGWTTYALYVHGWDRSAGPNEAEFDLDLQYRPVQPRWKAFSFRVRYAQVEQRDTGDTLTDLRFIVNYDLVVP